MKYYPVIGIILLLAIPLQAQHYHDVLLKEAQGPVKEIVSIEGGISNTYYDLNGQESSSSEQKKNRQYNAKGYLVAYETEELGITWSVKVDYDSSLRVKKQTYSTNGGSIVMDMSYNDKGHLEKSTVAFSTKDHSYCYTESFVYFTFDDHDNWLSRIRKRSRTAKYEERVIRYW